MGRERMQIADSGYILRLNEKGRGGRMMRRLLFGVSVQGDPSKSVATEQSEGRVTGKRIPVGRDLEGTGVPGPAVGVHLLLVYLSSRG